MKTGINNASFAAALFCLPWLSACTPASPEAPPAAVAKPALSVRTVLPQHEQWPQLLAASGSVMPWQEAVIGAEVGNNRIAEVLVQVGDTVRGGDTVASVGNSGGNPESGLYFELRYRGQPIDPLKWVNLK